MSNLNEYKQQIKVKPESGSAVDSGFGWRKVVVMISGLGVLAVMGFLFTSYPLEIIILLLFVASVLFMERR